MLLSIDLLIQIVKVLKGIKKNAWAICSNAKAAIEEILTKHEDC